MKRKRRNRRGFMESVRKRGRKKRERADERKEKGKK